MYRMADHQPPALQHQPVTVEMVTKEAVVAAIAMGGITDDRVGNMGQVAAQLMLAAGLRQQAHQAVAAGRMAS